MATQSTNENECDCCDRNKPCGEIFCDCCGKSWRNDKPGSETCHCCCSRCENLLRDCRYSCEDKDEESDDEESEDEEEDDSSEHDELYCDCCACPYDKAHNPFELQGVCNCRCSFCKEKFARDCRYTCEEYINYPN